MWRNWQTRRSQKPFGLTPVWVRFPPSPPFKLRKHDARRPACQPGSVALPVRLMRKSETTFDSIPKSAISRTTLKICLKCAFDFFTKQLKLAPRTAYSELRKHVPEEADFTGAATTRPHFLDPDGRANCPYCHAPK